MTKTFTENDLVRVLYDDATENQHQRVKQALLTDESIQETFFALQNVKNELDNVEIQVSKRLTQRIINKVSNLSEVSL